MSYATQAARGVQDRHSREKLATVKHLAWISILMWAFALLVLGVVLVRVITR